MAIPNSNPAPVITGDLQRPPVSYASNPFAGPRATVKPLPNSNPAPIPSSADPQIAPSNPTPFNAKPLPTVPADYPSGITNPGPKYTIPKSPSTPSLPLNTPSPPVSTNPAPIPSSAPRLPLPIGAGAGAAVATARSLARSSAVGAAAAAAVGIATGQDPKQAIGSAVGSVAGSVVGGAIGSLAGPIGTAIGAAAGSVLGGMLGGALAGGVPQDMSPSNRGTAGSGPVLYPPPEGIAPDGFYRFTVYGQSWYRNDRSDVQSFTVNSNAAGANLAAQIAGTIANRTDTNNVEGQAKSQVLSVAITTLSPGSQSPSPLPEIPGTTTSDSGGSQPARLPTDENGNPVASSSAPRPSPSLSPSSAPSPAPSPTLKPAPYPSPISVPTAAPVPGFKPALPSPSPTSNQPPNPTPTQNSKPGPNGVLVVQPQPEPQAPKLPSTRTRNGDCCDPCPGLDNELLQKIAKAVGINEFPKVLQKLAGKGFSVVNNIPQMNQWIVDNIDAVTGIFPTTITLPNDGDPVTVEFSNIATALEDIYIALNSGDMVDVEIKLFSSCKTEDEAKTARQTNQIIKTQTYDQNGNQITDPAQLPLVSESANYTTKTIKVPVNQAQMVKQYFDEMFKLQSKHCEQENPIISRIYKILGGDTWFKDSSKSEPLIKSKFDDAFKKGVFKHFDVDGKESEAESTNLLSYVNNALASLYYRTGIYQFPTKVQETMLTYSDEAEHTDINDFTTYFAWFLDQFDLLMGQFPIQIQIEDADLAKEGNQSLTVEMPNLSEALAETYGLAISASANADLAINFLMRLASEVIATKNATLITQDYAKANASFLGYRSNPKSRDVDYSFNPADMSAFDKFLQNSKGQIVGWSDESKETLIDYLQRLMFSAGIIKSVFMRNKDQVKQLKKELEALMTNPEDEKAWKEFIEQINNPKSAFNQGSESESTPPQFIDNKPVIKPENQDKKNG